ncbi:MAG TPA: EAL domain-containing protein [Methylococcaceae bacterium]|nr:EAL domain-containing protein [Methylococcaceae bacterium]
MRLPSWLALPRSSFFYQLAVTFTFGILCLSLLSSVAISELTYQIVREKLLAQGSQATKTFAEQSALALLYSSTESAQEPIRSTLAFPDVRGVAVYNAAHAPLATQGEPAEPEAGNPQWPLQLQLERETDQAWYFVAPVFAHRASEEENSPFVARPQSQEEELIGFVRLAMGKETLKNMEASLLRTNLGASGAFALVFLTFLLAITRRLTTPLKHLAGIMERASAGGKNLRANLKGSSDIVHMEMAFNNMMDVLELRERQLENARDAALKTARLKGEFAANVSHELRTPLNAVLGMLDLLESMGLSAEQYEYVTVARNAGDSLLLLIEEILDFSRLEAGMMKLHPTDFTLHEVLDEVVALLAGQARRKGLELDYLLEGDIPLSVHGERSRIRQVLVNLVGNAIKFTPNGGIEISVRPVGDVKGKPFLRFEVADTGVGIPLEAQKTIFEAFVQADGSSTRTFGGTGLGLTICRQLVEMMGGQIGVESEPGKGSRFWFTVLMEMPQESAENRPETGDEVANLNVLIVTDNPKTRHFLSQLLRRWEIAHDFADPGSFSLDFLRAAANRDAPYQFAIVDQSGPAGGVPDLAHLMARDPGLSGTRVILLANSPQTGAAPTEQPPNVVGCLHRPLQASTLYDLFMTHGRGSRKAHPSPSANEPVLYLDRRVLLVEDNRTNQQVAVGMLERIGCRADIAANGREALAWLRRRPYDLVLMDCHMPEMDGFEATRQIRALEDRRVAHIPVVALTAHVQKSEIDQCHAAGMDDYLAKPVRLAALRNKLHYWLGNGGGSPAAETAGERSEDDKSTAPLDSRVLRQLREEIGGALLTMIRVFLEDFPGQIRALEQAGANGEADTVRCLSHALKGAGRNLGAGPFAEIAARMESLASGGSIAEALALAGTLAEEFHRIKPSLEQLVAAGPEQQMPAEDYQLPLVLVADDDRAMRSALHDVLRKDGYRIEQAATGVQALAICRRNMPDLVLLDAMMPEMDGFTVCSRIRQTPEGTHIPVLIVTALDDESSINRAFAAGATDYIPKPVHFAVLRQRVARLLDARRAEEHLNYLAYHDVLTGLPNRTLFTERLEAIITQGGQEPCTHAVLFLDLDRFKLTNDTMGHEIGDLLLNAVAERIQRSVRAGDLVSRLGGDEFTVLLQNIGSLQIASIVAEKICRAVSEPFVFGDRELYISSSIGISVYPNDGVDSGLLLKHADTAMYRAKERGNTHCFYEDSMELAVSARLHLERDLRRALDRNEFILHYQPQIDIKSGALTGVEALVRWQHPENGMISPLQFIPLAEEIGLIEALGEWVLRNACKQNKAWQIAGLPRIPVAINLSARELERDDIAADILAILAETGLEPRYLELEITESAVMRDPDKTRHILNTLKARDIHISIDDFGTGYSSLSQLKNFPFDKLKIDKSFVCDGSTDSDNTAIMLTIIAIAKNMNLKVIAEGVETREQYEYLQKNDCDEMQGYYFSRPLAADDLTRLLEKFRDERTLFSV